MLPCLGQEADDVCGGHGDFCERFGRKVAGKSVYEDSQPGSIPCGVALSA